MNKNLLKPEVQNFIKENEDTDIPSLLLKKPVFDIVSNQDLAQQIEARKKAEKKLRLWFRTNAIYYPNKLNIEQTSSETTAKYKAALVSGKSLLDVTGGFGVDSYYFSRRIDEVVHCELNSDLSEIATYNFELLGARNINTFQGDGLQLLEQGNRKFDWIYLDPSRRNSSKGKVFRLSDSVPNVLEHLDLIFEKSDNLLLKTSPLLDLSLTIKELQYVKEIHIISIENEVKEVLWVLQKNYKSEITIKTRNSTKYRNETFDFIWNEEQKSHTRLSEPLGYLYEPNAVIMKSGAFKTVGERFKLYKLHKNTHLYTSENLIPFPGRVFKINEVLPYKKTHLKKIQGTRAHVTVRNFRASVDQIRKKYRIKDGGERYLFFSQLTDNKLYVLICSKSLTAS